MRLDLHRRKLMDTATFGDLFVDGVFECLTLEDVVRPDGVKAWGATAIPVGTYKVIVNMSPRFKLVMPRLLGVPMYDGIQIVSFQEKINVLRIQNAVRILGACLVE